MRKAILVSCLVLAMVLVGAIPAAAAHPDDQPDQVITVNPFGFFLGAYNLSYEAVTSPSTSYVISGLYWALDAGSWDISAIGLGGGLRYYLGGDAPCGFYVGPIASVAAVSASYYDDSANGVVVSLGGQMGLQLILQGGFTLDMNVAADYAFGKVTSGGEAAPVTGFGTAYGIGIGYAW